jgi:hypothetical protein
MRICLSICNIGNLVNAPLKKSRSGKYRMQKHQLSQVALQKSNTKVIVRPFPLNPFAEIRLNNLKRIFTVAHRFGGD